jgi:hypothetical protein
MSLSLGEGSTYNSKESKDYTSKKSNDDDTIDSDSNDIAIISATKPNTTFSTSMTHATTTTFAPLAPPPPSTIPTLSSSTLSSSSASSATMSGSGSGSGEMMEASVRWLAYERELFNDLAPHDALVVMARGLAPENMIYHLLRMHSTPRRLVFVLNLSSEHHQLMNERLSSEVPAIHTPFTRINNEFSEKERYALLQSFVERS